MNNHTPAPWLVQEGNDGVNYIHIIKEGEEYPIKIIAIVGNETEQHKANQKLILASPEMLEALQAAIKLSDDWFAEQLAAGHDLERTPECQAVYDKVKSAIHKATL